MSARLRLVGLDSLREALKRLPRELGGEGKRYVKEHAETARRAIVYPVHSGNLARGLRVRTETDTPLVTVADVENTAPHAWIFEHGTQARHNAIHGGGGRMPPGHVFEPPVEAEQRALKADLVALVERNGLKVRGG